MTITSLERVVWIDLCVHFLTCFVDGERPRNLVLSLDLMSSNSSQLYLFTTNCLLYCTRVSTKNKNFLRIIGTYSAVWFVKHVWRNFSKKSPISRFYLVSNFFSPFLSSSYKKRKFGPFSRGGWYGTRSISLPPSFHIVSVLYLLRRRSAEPNIWEKKKRTITFPTD